MNRKKKKKSSFWRRWRATYRFVIFHDETFEERFSYKLNRLNVFLAISISVVLLIAATFLVISKTQLKEYIPGYDSSELRRQAIRNNDRLDSLQLTLQQNQRYIASVNKVLRGDLDLQELETQRKFDSLQTDTDFVDFPTSKADSLLREDVAQDDKYNVLESATQTVPFVLFTPATGTISQAYDPSIEHYAVDVVVPRNTPVKAAAEGNVIFAGWTTETGYVVIIDHPYNIISVYKHNASLNVRQGDSVEPGQVIAVAGNSGTMTTGPHLHFELWSDGYALNPEEFIEFE
ncbi:MAG: peptidoglycan DD-metalloendopeptidase family protein [Bacteroidetes bacterium]|nr:peptidoglycan DD-metalloendopeptidase family protein [Bacteroidota bacterium]